MQEPEPDHKILGRLAVVALLLAFGIVGLMLWIA